MLSPRRPHLTLLTTSNEVGFSAAADFPHALSPVYLSGKMPRRSGRPQRRRIRRYPDSVFCSVHYKNAAIIESFAGVRALERTGGKAATGRYQPPHSSRQCRGSGGLGAGARAHSVSTSATVA